MNLNISQDSANDHLRILQAELTKALATANTISDQRERTVAKAKIRLKYQKLMIQARFTNLY